jgi:hypothetical protein
MTTRPMDSSPHGQLAPWTAHPMDSSPQGQLAPWAARPPYTTCLTDSSPHGQLATWTARPKDSSPHGQLAPWTARPMDSSPHGQLTPHFFENFSYTYRADCILGLNVMERNVHEAKCRWSSLDAGSLLWATISASSLTFYLLRG